jgi:hypothetical protein
LLLLLRPLVAAVYSYFCLIFIVIYFNLHKLFDN